MDISEIAIIISVFAPIATSLISFFAATSKFKKDIKLLSEQNRLDIEKIINQHRLDLEALERKHQMEIEKMELEHKHKVEIMQKEMENGLNSSLTESLGTQIISQVMQTPEIQSQIRQSARLGHTRRKSGR